MRRVFPSALVLSAILGTGALRAQTAAAPTVKMDQVTLKDGSIINGQIVGLKDGVLTMKTGIAADKELKLNWDQVQVVKAEGSHDYHHKDGKNVYSGPASSSGAGALAISAPGNPTITISMADIKSIDPVPEPAVVFKGFANIGVNLVDGNTQTKGALANAELEVRNEKVRFTISGNWNYQESKEGITARNARGEVKFDFFLTKKLYAFASALFEGDKFQDLALRTALSAGPGYQFIEPGDFSSPTLKDMSLSGEVGLAFFDEDYIHSIDKSYVSARWAVKFLWPLSDKKITLFHKHEGYPSLENANDLYISTEQGVRFALVGNFFATVQVNWRWDNTPAVINGKALERNDAVYMFTLGYNFEKAILAKK